MTDKTSESAPPLVKQIWEFLEEQLEVAEKKEMTVGRFVTAANESPHRHLESMLGKEVHRQGVLRGERDLRGVRAGTLEYANQPPTGFVLGIPQVSVQHGPSIYV